MGNSSQLITIESLRAKVDYFANTSLPQMKEGEDRHLLAEFLKAVIVEASLGDYTAQSTLNGANERRPNPSEKAQQVRLRLFEQMLERLAAVMIIFAEDPITRSERTDHSSQCFRKKTNYWQVWEQQNAKYANDLAHALKAFVDAAATFDTKHQRYYRRGIKILAVILGAILGFVVGFVVTSGMDVGFAGLIGGFTGVFTAYSTASLGVASGAGVGAILMACCIKFIDQLIQLGKAVVSLFSRLPKAIIKPAQPHLPELLENFSYPEDRDYLGEAVAPKATAYRSGIHIAGEALANRLQFRKKNWTAPDSIEWRGKETARVRKAQAEAARSVAPPTIYVSDSLPDNQRRSVGRYLHIRANFPAEKDLKSYKKSYLWIQLTSALYYVDPWGVMEEVTLDNSSRITDLLAKQSVDCLPLTEQAVNFLITSNGGHTPWSGFEEASAVMRDIPSVACESGSAPCIDVGICYMRLSILLANYRVLEEQDVTRDWYERPVRSEAFCKIFNYYQEKRQILINFKRCCYEQIQALLRIKNLLQLKNAYEAYDAWYQAEWPKIKRMSHDLQLILHPGKVVQDSLVLREELIPLFYDWQENMALTEKYIQHFFDHLTPLFSDEGAETQWVSYVHEAIIRLRVERQQFIDEEQLKGEAESKRREKNWRDLFARLGMTPVEFAEKQKVDAEQKEKAEKKIALMHEIFACMFLHDKDPNPEKRKVLKESIDVLFKEWRYILSNTMPMAAESSGAALGQAVYSASLFSLMSSPAAEKKSRLSSDELRRMHPPPKIACRPPPGFWSKEACSRRKICRAVFKPTIPYEGVGICHSQLKDLLTSFVRADASALSPAELSAIKTYVESKQQILFDFRHYCYQALSAFFFSDNPSRLSNAYKDYRTWYDKEWRAVNQMNDRMQSFLRPAADKVAENSALDQMLKKLFEEWKEKFECLAEVMEVCDIWLRALFESETDQPKDKNFVDLVHDSISRIIQCPG